MALKDYYNVDDNFYRNCFGVNYFSQSFTASSAYTLDSVSMKLARTGTPGSVYFDLYAADVDGKPTGSSLSSGTTNGDTLTTNLAGEWRNILMSSYILASGSDYALVINNSDMGSGDQIRVRFDSAGSGYDGVWQISSDSGSTWGDDIVGATGLFETYGSPPTVDHEVDAEIQGVSCTVCSATLTDMNAMSATIAGVGSLSADLTKLVQLDLSATLKNKTLVAAGNGEVWYEVSAGTMTELVAANGDIDTTDQLQMFSAFQKAFIINGANLKVADFVSIKLTHTALTNPHLHGDLITQDQGSSNFAYMIVDYTNTAKTATYGYAYYGGAATAFNTANNVTGDNGTTAVPSAVANAPHWYDLTVYPGTEATSEIPEVCYLGCRYRGRIVLAGNPKSPFQWYMSRVADPYDWLYVQGDAGSPIRGGNSDAGEIGDAVKALIPYHDDYLIFGCADSMWIMHGDAAAGGSLDPLTEETGIFGPNAYCWGDGGTLYFWGTNGLYKHNMPGKPQCISQMRLPNIIADEDAKPATHRITMAYDRIRVGINICITLMEDGTNSNYFYDLRASDDSGIGGFFPETYPQECGAYSLFYYGANDPDYRGILVGCKDGYIREFKDAAVDDDTGTTDTAIASSVLYGPSTFDGMLAHRSVLGNVDVTLSGVTDDVTCNVYAHRTAEQVAKDADAGTPIKATLLIRGPGKTRGNNLRQRIRSEFFGIELKNDNLGETWSVERTIVNSEPSGRRL